MLVNGIERTYVVHGDEFVKGFFGEYRWLSNYHECEVWFEGIKYNSTEAAYQAAKSTDLFIRQQFASLNPSDSKKMGQKITHRPNWHSIKYDIMSSIVFEKFFRNEELRELLLKTGDKYLEETNHWNDKFWGVCDDKGENSLGRILMAVRSFWQYKESSNPNKSSAALF